jgi:hypothetical protein
MAKSPSYPILYDEVLQINISKLKEWGFLKPGQFKSGTLTWSRWNEQVGRISIKMNTQSEHPYLELDYKCDDNPRKYKVCLVSIPSNIGKGEIWYFLCPVINKRCRKLYLVGDYFLHRDAFSGCMYDCQTKSKKYRNQYKIFDLYFRANKLSNNHFR